MAYILFPLKTSVYDLMTVWGLLFVYLQPSILLPNWSIILYMYSFDTIQLEVGWPSKISAELYLDSPAPLFLFFYF